MKLTLNIAILCVVLTAPRMIASEPKSDLDAKKSEAAVPLRTLQNIEISGSFSVEKRRMNSQLDFVGINYLRHPDLKQSDFVTPLISAMQILADAHESSLIKICVRFDKLEASVTQLSEQVNKATQALEKKE